MQEVDVGGMFLTDDVKHVDVIADIADHFRTFHEVFDEHQTLFYGFGLFETHFFGKFHHSFTQFAGHFAGVSLEYFPASLNLL